MKQVYSGAGVNTTSNVLSYLAGTVKPIIRNLYIIGTPENPYSLFMTDNESPVSYGLYPQQTFSPAVVTRGDIPCKIGLDADTVSIDWSPGPGTFSNVVSLANPRTLAQQGYFDNWPVTIFSCFMPTPGDANTLGCAVIWGGVISNTTVDRKKITWTIDSLLYALDQQVPTNVIELANTLASYSAATPPIGFTTIPQFGTFTGSTPQIIYGDVQPPYGTNHIFANNVFIRGFIQFVPGTGSTLDGFWSGIGSNSEFTDGIGNHHNQFNLITALPWAPVPYVAGSGDQFIVSAAFPLNQSDGDYYGFPYVPAPASAL